jgi:import receptor subunit TOM22
MVLVEEVPEDVLLAEGERDSDFETDSVGGSEVSFDDDEDDFYPASETLYERIIALKDILPPQTRSSLAAQYSVVKSWSWWSVQGAGSLAWWISTSALLVGLPLALAIEDEGRVVQQEREMQMQSAGQQQVSWL